jgi:hypothetical protein
MIGEIINEETDNLSFIEEKHNNEQKYNELKTLDHSFLQKYDVNLYGSDIDTYEKLKGLLESGDFKYPNKLGEILTDFKVKLEDAKLPLPSDLG